MRGAWILGLLISCFCPPPARGVQPAGRDIPPDRMAFVETLTSRSTYFVGEPIRVRLRIGFDPHFFETRAIQPFRRRLDVPLQLHVPWIDDLEGTLPLEPRPGAAGGAAGPGGREPLSLALNDGLARAARVADRDVDGRPFTVIEIERSYLPLRPEELVPPGPRLTFSYATRFREDLVGGRVGVDRRDVSISGRGLDLEIRALPESGRPPGFTGAVGRFSVEAAAHPLELEVGARLEYELRIEGEGNLGFFEAPRLDRLEGFHLYGRIEERGAERRTITYDLTPLSDEVRGIPSIPFAYFDTNPPARYRTIRTKPIALVVRPLPEGERLEERLESGGGGGVPGETDIHDLKPAPSLRGDGASLHPPAALLASVLLAPWLLALGLLLWVRARERDLRDPDGARARRAARAFRSLAREPGTDAAGALAGYLAARLRCPTAAVIAPDLRERLIRAGIPRDLAGRAARLLDELTAARFRGGDPRGRQVAGGVPAAAARGVVEELEGTFRAREAAS